MGRNPADPLAWNRNDRPVLQDRPAGADDRHRHAGQPPLRTGRRRVLGAVPAKGGPILLFLALEQNTSFAATSAAASLGGAGGCGVFCLVYALVCRRVSWPVAGAAAYGAFAVTWAAMLPVSALGLGPAFVVAVAILLVSRRLLPVAPPMPRRATSASDLPARMIAGAAMVVFVTTAGPYFGATISGMLATIPTVAAVLAIFTHAQEGPDRTIGVMRGMTHGLLGFAAFLTVVAALPGLARWSRSRGSSRAALRAHGRKP